MTIRLQITFFLILISLIGVVGSSLLILQSATSDKKNYVTELSSVLSPQIKNSIDQKIHTLLLDLKNLSDLIENTSEFNSKTIIQKNYPEKYQEKYFETLKLRLKNIETIVIYRFNSKLNNKLITVNLGTSSISEEDYQVVNQTLRSIPPDQISSEYLTFIKSNIYLYRTSNNSIVAILLNSDFFKDSFELARGKRSLLVNTQNQILYSEKVISEDIDFMSSFPTSTLINSELLTQEIKDLKGRILLTNSSKLNRIKDCSVLILTPQVTWKDLATPLLKSSLSLIFILITFSIIIAYYISRSLAKPIELLTDETSKIGVGEWKTLTLINSKNEISKLGIAFNNMIFNLINRENELKIAHNKLIQSESLAAVGRIASGIAHEVKNPLSSILGYCQLIEINLKSMPLDTTNTVFIEKIEKFKNYNKFIIDDTRRANKIISDLLTFSRQKEIQPEKINLIDYLHLIDPKLKAFCEANGVSFKTDFQKPNLENFVKIDTEQIYQVLFNLVQNSVHSVNSADSPNKLIQLVVYFTTTHVCIDITDNGPGISETHITKIFEPFYSTKKVGEGSGLGLSICYGIILQHNGQILVESIPHQLTSFKIKLPFT